MLCDWNCTADVFFMNYNIAKSFCFASGKSSLESCISHCIAFDLKKENVRGIYHHIKKFGYYYYYYTKRVM